MKHLKSINEYKINMNIPHIGDLVICDIVSYFISEDIEDNMSDFLSKTPGKIIDKEFDFYSGENDTYEYIIKYNKIPSDLENEFEIYTDDLDKEYYTIKVKSEDILHFAKTKRN